MLFQTPTFVVFFAIFAGLYLLTQGRLRLQNALILLGSYIFYAAWDERFLVLIIASTATDFLAGLGASGRRLSQQETLQSIGYLIIGSLLPLLPTLPESVGYLAGVVSFAVSLGVLADLGNRIDEDERRRRYFITLSVCVNLGILAVFKYFNFFADSLVATLAEFGVENVSWTTLEIVLPVGISFYTFQTISYSIDVHRGEVEPSEHLLEFAAFVAFFPQLVAGPVERAKQLLPQFFETRRVEWSAIETGVTLFVWGLFKKTVVADNLAGIVDPIFAAPSSMTSGDLAVGLLAFAFQIYGDFSGYSDMARGLARILGFEIMLNFNLPYFSRTPSEFWERWHISLSSWLRDYLYIPLGGNRKGVAMTYRNLMLTMLLGGLWHGANWTFVLWGAYQGGILVLYRIAGVDAWIRRFGKDATPAARRALDVALTSVMFVLVLLGWMIFRADDLDVLGAYLAGLFDFSRGLTTDRLSDVLFYIAPLLFIQVLQHTKGRLEIFPELPGFARLNLALFVLVSIIFMQPFQTVAFIYFDF